MEQMYRDYKDIAEFRMVYISEAHASDSNWPVGYADELGITEHDDYGERCEAASKLLDDKSLTIPLVIDDMNDSVNKAYRAWPDRVFVVRTDGRLAVAADRGPFGFKPALDAAKKWLKTFEEAGEEPPLPQDAAAAGEDVAVDQSTEEDESSTQPDREKTDDKPAG